MKKIIICTLLIALAILASCKKEKLKKALIEKDCTGVYIRKNSKDYYVLNPCILDSYNDGDKISLRFKEIDNKESLENPCSQSSENVCLMIHKHKVKASIEITELLE